MSNGLREDLRNTIDEMKRPSGLKDGKNWLRHGGLQEIVIDEMCLKGATEEEMANEIIRRGFDRNKKGFSSILKRVRTHIQATKASIDKPMGHGLPITKDAKGKLQFDLKKMEEMAGLSSKKSKAESQQQSNT